MQNRISMDGICKTSLALGLGSRANDHFVQTSSNNNHHVQQKMMMKKACLRYDHMLPSLTLGLVQEDDHDHDHNKLAIATSSPILSPQEHSSNLSNGGVSSFSNSSSVKKERLDLEISTGDQEIDDQVERVITSPGPHDDQEDEEGSPRKKLRLTKQQSAILEDNFKEHSSLNPKQKQALAEQLNLRPRQVEVWFQNRRARTKLKQTEVECELLKKCCEKLTEENKRLHKELQDLKSAAPISYMHLPAATLTMCPSCERIGGGSSGGGGGGSSTTSGFSSNNGPKPHFYKSFCTHPSAACYSMQFIKGH